MIMMDFKQAYHRIYRIAMEKALEAMHSSETIIVLVKLIYVESETIVITDNEKGERITT